MEPNYKRCHGCMWYNQCVGVARCDMYDPIEDEMDVELYESDLRLRAELYDELIREQDE